MPRPNYSLPTPASPDRPRVEIDPAKSPGLRALAAELGLSVASLCRVVVEMVADRAAVTPKTLKAEVARRRGERQGGKG